MPFEKEPLPTPQGYNQCSMCGTDRSYYGGVAVVAGVVVLSEKHTRDRETKGDKGRENKWRQWYSSMRLREVRGGR